MLTLPLIVELYTHMEWADAHVWRVALATPDAQGDTPLLDRLLHIHLTQRAFLQVWQARPLERSQGLRFSGLPELWSWAAPFYREIPGFLSGLSVERLADTVTLPWVKYFRDRLGQEPAVPTLGETLFQLTSHTTYHRGQVNTRLRELGAEPPLVDYIAWIWQSRPAAAWPAPAPPASPTRTT
jgi:uncharacterized damage-inducible protein DinB